MSESSGTNPEPVAAEPAIKEVSTSPDERVIRNCTQHMQQLRKLPRPFQLPRMSESSGTRRTAATDRAPGAVFQLPRMSESSGTSAAAGPSISRSERVSISPDERVIRNSDTSDDQPALKGEFQLPRMSESSGTRVLSPVERAFPSAVSTSPDERVIRNSTITTGHSAPIPAFQLPRMSESSGTVHRDHATTASTLRFNFPG